MHPSTRFLGIVIVVVLGIGAAFTGLSSSRLAAATITVDPAGGGDFADIQPALDAAGPGDMVLVRPGDYVVREPLDPNRLHDPANPGSHPVKDIVLRSAAGPESTIVRMAAEPLDPGRASVIEIRNGEGVASVVEG